MKYLNLSFDSFDWDSGNASKVRERVSIAEIEELFKNKVLIREDMAHSNIEKRFIAMGKVKNRILFVAYTIRDKETQLFLRIISARYVHSNSREEELYEKAKEVFEKK